MLKLQEVQMKVKEIRMYLIDLLHNMYSYFTSYFYNLIKN